MVGGPWSALFHSCFLGIHVPLCWAGLSPEGRDGVLEGLGRGVHSLLTVSLQVGLGLHSGVPGAVCDTPPQWQPLPGQLWPPRGLPASPPTQSSSLRPEEPMRGSVCAQRLSLEKLSLSQSHSLNHHSTNEIKFTLRGFPGCGSLLLVATSLKLKLPPSLASGELQPGLVNAMARTGLTVPRAIPSARAEGQAVDGGCGLSCSLPSPFPNPGNISCMEGQASHFVFSTWCSSFSYCGCTEHCSPRKNSFRSPG